MRLLLVEDDPMIGKAVKQGLSLAGFTVDWVLDGRHAEAALRGADAAYDLAVLDLGLPGRDGMAILAALRTRDDKLPVMIASARDAVADRIAGLDAGADDYVLKPFDLDELAARARALLRRRSGNAQATMSCGAIELDPARKRVTCDGQPVDLSAREWKVLEALMREPGKVLSREALERSVYGWDDEIASNAIEVHLHHLRKKLGAGAIQNIRGVGYRMARE